MDEENEDSDGPGADAQMDALKTYLALIVRHLKSNQEQQQRAGRTSVWEWGAVINAALCNHPSAMTQMQEYMSCF